MVGYIGANGAGKSTTIKMLTGILTPTSGEIVCNGFVPYRERTRYVATIGVVFGQRTQLWWDIAVVESFRLLKEIYGLSDAEYRERMDLFDKVLGIAAYLHQPVRKLSLGERMRCDLAASLLHRPPLLFLDEPTIGLDIVAKANVREFLQEINRQEGTTVLLTTHDLADIETLCRRVIVIDHGRLLFDGALYGAARPDPAGHLHRLRRQDARRTRRCSSWNGLQIREVGIAPLPPRRRPAQPSPRDGRQGDRQPLRRRRPLDRGAPRSRRSSSASTRRASRERGGRGDARRAGASRSRGSGS